MTCAWFRNRCRGATGRWDWRRCTSILEGHSVTRGRTPRCLADGLQLSAFLLSYLYAATPAQQHVLASQEFSEDPSLRAEVLEVKHVSGPARLRVAIIVKKT